MSKKSFNSSKEPTIYTLYLMTINNENQNASRRKKYLLVWAHIKNGLVSIWGGLFFVGDGGIKLKQKMELWRKNHDLINANRSKWNPIRFVIKRVITKSDVA